MSAYFIALIDIHDPQRYEKYLEGFDSVFEKYRGRVVAVEDSPILLEGEWPAGRTVLMEFPDEDELRRWYESGEYQLLAEHRKEASFCRVVAVRGRD
jgi:uncharacterized protein (DUF1330 family)